MRRDRLQRRLGTLEERSRVRQRRFDRRRYAYLDCYRTEELEELVVLAEKYERDGVATVWSEAELEALERLGQVEARCRAGS